MASSQAGVTDRYPHLRRLLVGAEAREALTPLCLSLYLMATHVTRTTGIVARLDRARGVGHLLAEFASWPLGWVVTLDGAPVEGTVDVSAWTKHGFHDKVDLAAQLPCHWVVSMRPVDFTPPEPPVDATG